MYNMAAGLYDITNETLGKGHFAVVKLAKHCLTGEYVAVKVIDKTKLNNEGLQQLGLEIRLLSRLSEQQHPNIVKLYQVIDTKTKLYLVMEYCGRDVCDLYDYIQKRLGGNGLNEDEAKHIFRQICSAISYCHSLRIVHRDLKPENILIVNQPSDSETTSAITAKYPIVKLIDFGFSNQWDEGQKLRTSCGSLAYSAPEILLGDHYDGDKVDIWGLGCILYILLYGSNPFMQINDSETLIRILDCTFSTPPRPTISDSAIALIKALLRKDPGKRLTIKQVTVLNWLVDEDVAVTISNLNEVEAAVRNISPVEIPASGSIHDRVVDQMIAQPMCLSRDQVERALKVSGDSSNVNRSASSVEVGTDATPVIGDIESTTGSGNDNYITATYNLLKDKLLREIQGISSNNSNVHEIRNLHHKRGNQLRQRKQLVQQPPRFRPSFAPSFTPMASTAARISTSDEPALVANTLVNQVEIMEEEHFNLPLQRKCSIVSEEGSCAGAELSGHNSETGGSDVHTFLVGDDDGITVRRSHPSVNIVVTDYSADDLKNDIPLEEMELNEVESEVLLEEIVSQEKYENEEAVKSGPEPKLGTNAPSLGEKLHQVSSSPDFHRDLEEEDEQIEEARSSMQTSHKQRRPVTMVLTSDQGEADQVNDFVQQVPKRNQKSSIFKRSNGSSTSMRVIIQSKSCNDILFKESDGKNSTDGKNSKGMSSGCGQLIKRNRTERTDCCTIC